MRKAAALLIVLASAETRTDARADSTDLVTRPLALERHQFHAQLSLEISPYERMVGKPIALAPDFWVGVTEQLTVGVIHSSQSVDRIGARATVCLRQSDLLCDGPYQGSGLDVRYRLSDGPFAIAPRMRLLVRDIDPWKPAVTLGTLARWSRGRFSIKTDPYLRLGLANRDKGNRAAFVLPFWFGVQPTCRWLVELHTGADGDIAVLSDGWHVPFGLVVTARATETIDVSVEVGATQIYGYQVDSKQRYVMFSASYRSRGRLRER
ncbi:MAG: hypothetical protein H0T65_21370 [Deltaproteobacteria bacterium]|nr:hypothetical protein [Deltaproteobacteria bacterium]